MEKYHPIRWNALKRTMYVTKVKTTLKSITVNLVIIKVRVVVLVITVLILFCLKPDSVNAILDSNLVENLA